jgi:hypothetical protein
MNIEDYAVVKATNLEKLRELVKEGFDDGWVPQGSVAVVSNNYGNVHGESALIFFQAMIKVRV